MGIAKALQAQGQEVFTNWGGKSLYGVTSNSNSNYDLFILDDIRNLDGSNSNAFWQIVLHAYERGKKVIVVSQKPCDAFLSKWKGTSAAECATEKDKIECFMNVLKIEGGSQRRASSWMSAYNDEEEPPVYTEAASAASEEA